MKTTSKAVEKVAGKVKQAVAEVTGDSRLSDEGRRQQRRADDKAAEDEKTDVATIANNLT